MDFEDYSVALASGDSIILPYYWLCNTLHSPIANIRVYKHHKVTKVDKKKVKGKRRTAKRNRKHNR